jgi:hypothetical protein
MVLGPFAETKGPRLPGRNPATPNITLKRRTGDKSVVESFVRRYGEAVRRQMLQKADGKEGDRISSTTDLYPYPLGTCYLFWTLAERGFCVRLTAWSVATVGVSYT